MPPEAYYASCVYRPTLERRGSWLTFIAPRNFGVYLNYYSA